MEKTLAHVSGIQEEEAGRDDTVVAPSRKPEESVPASVINAEVEILATLPNVKQGHESGDIIAVRQGNCFGTSFHPELTNDPRIHIWWLNNIVNAMTQ